MPQAHPTRTSRAAQEHGLQRIPALLREVAHRCDVVEARVRNDGVELPVESRQCGVDDGTVALDRGEIGVVDVHAVDGPAVVCQSLRDRCADAACGTGDEREAVHR
jgi:hypothetical protein